KFTFRIYYGIPKEMRLPGGITILHDITYRIKIIFQVLNTLAVITGLIRRCNEIYQPECFWIIKVPANGSIAIFSMKPLPFGIITLAFKKRLRASCTSYVYFQGIQRIIFIIYRLNNRFIRKAYRNRSV